MTNYQIADVLSLLAKIMDIHGENSFKTKSYANAAFQIEKLTDELATMDTATIAAQRGIGHTMAQKINELLQTGTLSLLENYLANTPPGVVEMLHIKGLGPKKIHTIWKEMGIETLGELQYACHENRLTMYKGFGEKTQNNVAEAIAFYLNQQGFFLYQQAESIAETLLNLLQTNLPQCQWALTGAYRRQEEVLEQIDILTDASISQVENLVQEIIPDYRAADAAANTLLLAATNGPRIQFHFGSRQQWGWHLWHTTGSDAFCHFLQPILSHHNYETESAIFEALQLSYIPPCLRHNERSIDRARQTGVPVLIEPADIKGIIHSHSKWSDGNHTIEEMAVAAKAAGYEYLVISDHSRSASYANGLQEERIRQQHIEIEKLNKQLAPFKIFKSIECDIVSDGSLDYGPEILATFDLVIASIHANLRMTEEKAMQRLMGAISNPYTSILGHMTGRLLLSRNGYPIDHQAIIAACIQHGVAIELNAHPRRLDMDWRWIETAIQQGAIISINPDAHAIEGFEDTRYGVLAAQKGWLTAKDNLSSFTLPQFENWIKENKIKKGLAH